MWKPQELVVVGVGLMFEKQNTILMHQLVDLAQLAPPILPGNPCLFKKCMA